MQSQFIRLSRRGLPALAGGLLFALSLTAAEPSAVEVPIISVDAGVQQDLQNLDRLLVTNPALEEKLRANVDQLTQEKFRVENPDIDALLKQQPGLTKALKSERHFFIHRYVARLANNQGVRKDAIALDDFLTAHPEIAKPLARKPSQIVDADFLIAHPALATFCETHPALSSVLLERAAKPKSGKVPAKK
jgi:hypothetical protein